MRSHPSTEPSLEINQDMVFQRRTWIAERIGWAAMAVLVIGAALGAFAAGPMSWTTVRDPQGRLSIEYGRLQRRSAPATVKVLVPAETITPEGLTIEVDRAFIEAFKIETIRPEPRQSTAISDGMRLQFGATPREPATIVFYCTAERIGLSRPRLGLAGRELVELPVFVYP